RVVHFSGHSRQELLVLHGKGGRHRHRHQRCRCPVFLARKETAGHASITCLVFAAAGTPGGRCQMYGMKLVAAVLLVFPAAPAMTQEHQHGHGEKLGEVHFAISCNEAAQREFNRAVALLHSFQFNRAIEGFNAALGEDPTCAIAYWGIALSDWSNPFAPGSKDSGQLRLGRENAERGKSLGAKTDRERGYLAAVGKLYTGFEITPQRTRLLAYRDAMAD